MTRTERLIDATCPECRGPMREIRHDNLAEYRCLVGHAYSALSFLVAHHETEERALWSAVVALEEYALMVKDIRSQLPENSVKDLDGAVKQRTEFAGQIRELLRNLEPIGLY
jgi:two-component system, chemotaxis family, protein-glutamate methylesterase/glutaminase